MKKKTFSSKAWDRDHFRSPEGPYIFCISHNSEHAQFGKTRIWKAKKLFLNIVEEHGSVPVHVYTFETIVSWTTRIILSLSHAKLYLHYVCFGCG